MIYLNKLSKHKSISILTFLVLFFMSCIRKDWENPFDPDTSLDSIPSINITSPRFYDEFYFGFKSNITWINNDCNDNVKIDLYQFDTLKRTLAQNEINEGSFQWRLSSSDTSGISYGKNYKIRISSIDNYFVRDTSDYFTIREAPEIKNIIINDNKPIYVDYLCPIQWRADSLNHNVQIQLIRGMENTLIAGNLENDGEYSDWIVPINKWSANDYIINISSTYDSQIYAEKQIEIKWPEFQLLDPYNGQTLVAGGYYNIRWNAPQIKRKIRILLYNWNVASDPSGFIKAITDSTENSGTFRFKVPLDLIEDNSYQINLIHAKNSSIQSVKPENKDIWPKFDVKWPNIYIASPIANEILVMGTFYNILWGSSFQEFAQDNLVKISLRQDMGEFITIIDSVENTKQWNWFIPVDSLQESNNYQIKIETIENPQIFGISNPFSIIKQ
ncbi:Ser-Thr-rich GPI-anchored membrane family protein [Candidatus Neomarinimicrobiota bacterium]